MSGSDAPGRALRVAILIGRFPPHDVGGAERQADRFAAALAARGHEVTVITRRWPGRAARETRDGFAIVRTPVALTGVARSALDAVVTLDELRRMRPRPDVVLAFQTFVSGWIAGLADLALGLPSVVWVRGENEYRFDRMPRLYPFSKLAWKQARRVLVQSEAHRPALLEHVARRNPLLAERLAPCLETLGNGVDVPAVPLPPGDDWLYVGRLIAHKRVDVLLEALASVRGTAAERPLWIVGDGPERAALEARAKALGVDARFAGMRTREELASWHARARAIVLPSSEGEGLPNALLEAMAAGVPAIATRLPGVEELVRGAGELATAGQPASFAQALLALSDPDARARASTAARERGAACGWDAMAARLERVLAEASASKIATARPGRPARGPIRLALVLDKTFVGGVELLMLDVFKNFDQRVVEPRLICLRTAGPLAADYRAAGFRVDVMGRTGRFDPRTLPRLVKALRQGGTDAVLVTHHHRASLALGRLGAQLSGVPVNLVAAHDMDLTRVGRRCLPRWAVATLRASDALVLLSPSQGEYLHREEQVGRHPWSTTKEVVIPNGVATKPRPDKSERAAARARLGLRAEDFVVGIVARLSAQKAHHVLFEAFARLREGHSHARLVVVGGGDREMELRALAARLWLEDSVLFTGARRDVPALLPAFDVSCLSSVHEGVPMAAIESMAAGIPMVVTDCGALRDMIVDGEHGFIVPVGDSFAMAERLLALADDSKLRERLGESAHSRVQRTYRIEHTARGYEDLLVGLLGAR